MGFIQDLKTNKETQQKVLDKLASMPWLINGLATTVNIGSRVLAPFNAIGSLLTIKYKQRTVSLNKATRDQLRVKVASYMSLMQDKADSYGFIGWEECDALLFTGLVGAVGHRVRIEYAMDKRGMWHRRPLVNGVDTCYQGGGSGSTISRDMLLGLLWYVWRNKRLDLAEELWDYGARNRWIMGEGDISRIYLTPGLQATLAEIIFRLGGTNRRIARNLPQSWPTGLEGYQAHLEILHILLLGELRGYITSSMEEALYDISGRYPQNYLCTIARARYAERQPAADDLGASVAIGLSDTSLWPDGSLPSDADRSSRWIFENNDLSKGTDPTEFHTGGDLVFCGSLTLDYSDELVD